MAEAEFPISSTESAKSFPLDRHGCKIIPFFTSTSITDSYKLYTEVLGMKCNIHPPLPATPTFASFYAGKKAAVNFYVVKQDDARSLPSGRCMVMVRNLDGLREVRETLKSSGVVIEVENEAVHKDVIGAEIMPEARREVKMGPLEDKEWGYRQFDFWDMDRNQIVFFAFLQEE